MKQTEVISFYTDKGGTGKSTLDVSLCSYLSYELGKRTILFDGDHPSHHVSELRQREMEAVKDESIWKIMDGFCKVKDNTYEVINVKDDFDKVVKTIEALKGRGSYDYIIIDLPGALSSEFVRKVIAAKIVDRFYLPTSMDKTVIISNIKLAQQLKRFAGHVEIVWNNTFHYEKEEVYRLHSEMIRDDYGIPVAESRVGNSVYFRRELGNDRMFFKSTLCYPSELINGKKLNITSLFEEII